MLFATSNIRKMFFHKTNKRVKFFMADTSHRNFVNHFFCWKERLDQNENWRACCFKERITVKYLKYVKFFLTRQCVFKCFPVMFLLSKMSVFTFFLRFFTFLPYLQCDSTVMCSEYRNWNKYLFLPLVASYWFLVEEIYSKNFFMLF